MKSRYRILGLCLMAVFALGAVASATASAAAPEFFHCVKLTSKTGGYTSSSCALASKTKTGEFEKNAVPAKSKIKFTDTLGTTRFYRNSTGTSRVVCGKGTATGEVSGPKEVTAVEVTFKECQFASGSLECPVNSPFEGAGEIYTRELSGELGKVTAAEAPGSETGLELKAVNYLLLEWEGSKGCGQRVSGAFEGGFIGEVELTGLMDTTGALRFGVKGSDKTRQTIQRFEGGGKVNLEWQTVEAGFESSNELTFEEPIEVT
jgi:hypothetical protein